MISGFAWSGWLVARIFSAPDPLAPVGQDPDTARDLACELTAPDRICSPPTPKPQPPPDYDPPSVPGGGGIAALGWLLVILLVLALIAIVVWIGVMVVRNRGDVESADLEDLDEDLDGEPDERIIDVERPPDRWRRAAAEHRAAGRFRDAVRCEYRALVGDLARAGFVDEIPGRTSGEERDQLRTLAPTVSPTFDRAADIFDAAWFDDGEVTARHDDDFTNASRVVLDDVLAGGRRSRP